MADTVIDPCAEMKRQYKQLEARYIDVFWRSRNLYVVIPTGIFTQMTDEVAEVDRELQQIADLMQFMQAEIRKAQQECHQ